MFTFLFQDLLQISGSIVVLVATVGGLYISLTNKEKTSLLIQKEENNIVTHNLHHQLITCSASEKRCYASILNPVEEDSGKALKRGQVANALLLKINYKDAIFHFDLFVTTAIYYFVVYLYLNFAYYNFHRHQNL